MGKLGAPVMQDRFLTTQKHQWGPMTKSMTRILTVGMITGLLTMDLATAANEPVPKLPLAEAIKLLKDETAMSNWATNRNVVVSLQTLTTEEQQQLLAELLPMLTNPPAGSRAGATCNAFVAAGIQRSPTSYPR
jgi:hypothetical protein